MRIRTLARLLGALALFLGALAALGASMSGTQVQAAEPAAQAAPVLDFSGMEEIADSKQGGKIIRFPNLPPVAPGTETTEAEEKGILRAWDKKMNHDPKTGKRLPPTKMLYLIAIYPCCSTEMIKAGLCKGRDYLACYDRVELPPATPSFDGN